MRNRFGISLPTLFEWKVARAGYRWIEVPDGRLICAVDAERPDWWGSDHYETPYQPLDRTGLFREFAELEPTEKGILDLPTDSACSEAQLTLPLTANQGRRGCGQRVLLFGNNRFGP
jgi:hypothetical protein